jgi:imidazole glycerol-phosphate synthase
LTVEFAIAVSGLGVIPGVVRRFDSSKGLIVPHIGWNALEITKDTQLLQEVHGNHVYFVHSYHALLVSGNSI